MASWIPVIISLPLPILAGLLLYRVKQDPDRSFIFLSLRAADTRIAIKLIILGFSSLLILRLYNLSITGSNYLISAITGSFLTISLTTAFIILNITVRGPTGRFYHLLPASWLPELKRRTGYDRFTARLATRVQQIRETVPHSHTTKRLQHIRQVIRERLSDR